MNSSTGLIYHKDYLLHRQPCGHPERPERLTAVLDYLEKTGLMKELKLIEPSPAALDDVLAVHSREYIEKLKTISESGGGFFERDTYVCEQTYRIALLASGGLVSAADTIMKGDVKNAFALVRPPGHHAEENKAMGFCYINNPAVCARYLQKKHKIKKVLIFDWDAHAANGTTRIFYRDPTVLVITVHQDPFTLYPGTGFMDEVGECEGRGFTVNIPLPPGSGNAEYVYLFDEFVKERVDKFKPDFVIASAGMDSHRSDSLANLALTKEGYACLTERLMELAGKHCKKRFLVELEGGYDLKSLAESVHSVIEALRGNAASEFFGSVNDKVKEIAYELKSSLPVSH